MPHRSSCRPLSAAAACWPDLRLSPSRFFAAGPRACVRVRESRNYLSWLGLGFLSRARNECVWVPYAVVENSNQMFRNSLIIHTLVHTSTSHAFRAHYQRLTGFQRCQLRRPEMSPKIGPSRPKSFRRWEIGARWHVGKLLERIGFNSRKISGLQMGVACFCGRVPS